LSTYRETGGMASRQSANNGDLPMSVRNQLRAAEARSNSALYSHEDFNPLDKNIDLIWAHQYSESRAPHSYFDYFYTGNDIQVYIDGAEEVESPTGKLPIMQFAYNIQQQKQPLYGFWSYTFDSVMRGTRIISGAFRIATTTPYFMRNTLAKAADSKINETREFYIRGLDNDEQNTAKYWDRNLDIYNSANENKNLWSAHPPFSFVVVYGIQDTSLISYNDKLADVVNKYNNDTPLMTNQNERLIESDPTDHTSRVIIENVELVSMQTEFDSSGQPCSEVYNFFAADTFNRSPKG
jgi:hypothetical protein